MTKVGENPYYQLTEASLITCAIGLMGGVNTARNYAELMGFGHWDEQQKIVVVDKPLLQGGIVSNILSGKLLRIPPDLTTS